MNKTANDNRPYRQPGARWLRCDLHVHTPFDKEKKFGANVKHVIEAFKKERPEKLAAIAGEFIAACRDADGGKGMDLVALTDHNSIAGYRYLKPQFDIMAQQARDREENMLVVLPGVEFSVGGERGIHFLVIFAINTTADEVEGAIRYVFGTKEPFNLETGTPEASGNSVQDFLKKLREWCHPDSGERELSYVILPAHADGRSGIAGETGAMAANVTVDPNIWDEMKGRVREFVITRRDWNGFQTRKPYGQLPEEFKNLLARWRAAHMGSDWDKLDSTQRSAIRAHKHWPLVEASDPESYEQVGTRYTWLKMEVPDIEGIRLSLLDPESRLRRMSEPCAETSYPVIQRLRINETDFFDHLELGFNPWMNTLAGGRGTGKSTIIECLRYVLNRDRPEDFEDDEDEIRRQVEHFLQPKRGRDHGQTPGTLLPAHSVTVDILVSGRKYRIKRSAEGITYIVDPDSENAEETRSLDVRHLIVPRILSQRQIGRIARDPAAQRRELDNLAGQETINAFSEQRRSILEELEQFQLKRRQFKEQAATLPGKETEFKTVWDQIAFLEKGGNKEVIDTCGACREEERWLDKILDGLENRDQALAAESKEFEKLRELIGTPPAGPSQEWIKKISDRVQQKIEDWKNSLASIAEQIHKFRTELSGEKESVWQPINKKAENAYTQLQEAMQEHGVEFKQHQALLQRRALLDKQIADLKKISGQQREIEVAITKVRNRLVELHQRRCETRRSLAALLEDQDADVRMDVHPFSHKEALKEKREEWFGGSGLQARDWDVLVDFVYSEPIATHLARMAECLAQDIDATRAKGRVLERDESKVVSLMGGGDSLTVNFFNALQRADRINVDAIERFLPEDAVETKVRDQEGVFKPIDLGSIGLKSTAVLSLLLAAKDQPLIIDQPEDDLDNLYVYTVVVNLLRKRKFSRQIIIATHNANIPVNGDAESIAAFEVVNRMGRLKVLGSIDRPDVKEEVSMIMEGSAEAFRLRRDRYGY